MEAASGFPSDTNMLVATCIARVREAAGLDEHPVLPPPPVVAPRREVAVIAAADVVAASRAPAPSPSRASTPPRARTRWPLLACIFVAATAAGAAVFASPVGRHPAVSHATHAAEARAGSAVAATVAFVRARVAR